MKYLIAITIFTTLLISVADARCAQGHVVTNNNYSFDRTLTRTYSKNQCWRGYNMLKRALKFQAKELCRTRGRLCMTPLVMKHWTKIRCVKNRRPGHRTTVTVTGNFKAVCNVHH